MGRQYKKRESSYNATPHYVDGKIYPSLFALAIDFEFSYSTLRVKLALNNGSPIKYSRHIIYSAKWLQEHPDFDLKKYAGKNGKEIK